MLVVPAKSGVNNYSRQIVFLKWRVANLLVGFPDIEICFGTRVRSLPDALRIATPKKRLPGAGGGFLTRYEFSQPPESYVATDTSFYVISGLRWLTSRVEYWTPARSHHRSTASC